MKTVLFQTIQFSISSQFSSIWTIDRTLSGTTTPGQSGPGIDGNEGVLHIPQNSSIAGTSSSDCLVTYPGGVLPLCWEAVGVFYSPSRLDNLHVVRNQSINLSIDHWYYIFTVCKSFQLSLPKEFITEYLKNVLGTATHLWWFIN